MALIATAVPDKPAAARRTPVRTPAPRRGGFDTNGISIGNGKAARARLCGNGNETKPRFLYRRRFQTSDAEPQRDRRDRRRRMGSVPPAVLALSPSW